MSTLNSVEVELVLVAQRSEHTGRGSARGLVAGPRRGATDPGTDTKMSGRDNDASVRAYE
jgi:hypothetical protein